MSRYLKRAYLAGYFQEIFDKDIVGTTDQAEAQLQKFKKDIFFSTPLKTLMESRFREEPLPVVYAASDSISKLVELFGKVFKVVFTARFY